MKRRIVWLWLLAMLLAVMVAMWPAESRRSTDPVSLGAVIDGGIEEHSPRLVTIEAMERAIGPCGVVHSSRSARQQVEPIQRPRVRAVRRTARGPPGSVVRRCAGRKS